MHQRRIFPEVDSPRTIPALTICQPWAWAIAHGPKRVENRTWRTRYRGPLLIQAGASRKLLATASRFFAGLASPVHIPERLAYGAIIGVCEIFGCVRFDPLRSQANEMELPAIVEASQAEFASGPWCWLLRDVRSFAEPIPWKGRQGLFRVPADILPPEAVEDRSSTPHASRSAALAIGCKQ